MSLKLKDIIRKKETEDLVLTYEGSFRNGEGRLGTTVAADIVMRTTGTGATVVNIDFGDCTAKSPEEALDKLTLWLKEMAEIVKNRKPVANITIFGS
jgi:hypothetical protein